MSVQALAGPYLMPGTRLNTIALDAPAARLEAVVSAMIGDAVEYELALTSGEGDARRGVVFLVGMDHPKMNALGGPDTGPWAFSELTLAIPVDFRDSTGAHAALVPVFQFLRQEPERHGAQLRGPAPGACVLECARRANRRSLRRTDDR